MRNEAGLVLTLLEGRDSDFPAKGEVKLPGKRWRETPPVVRDAASSWGILGEASLLLLVRRETLGERFFAALTAPGPQSRGIFALFLCCWGQ